MSSRPIRTLATLTYVAAFTLSSGCAPAPQSDEPSVDRSADQSAATATAATGRSPLWVDSASAAARQVRLWRDQGRTRDAELVRRIADEPLAIWPSGDDPGPSIRAATAAAASANRTVLLVAYNIPHRDCGQYSAGGAHSAERYRQWIGAFADNIGSSRAVVVLEPDALAHIVVGCTPAVYHEERYRLLSEAVERLKGLPRTQVYLDAGNPGWISDPSRLAQPLRRANVDRADGFALNVANFQTDESTREYGHALSRLLGGTHMVIDTSRNGNGPPPDDLREAWCNPSGRALGTRPTTQTGDPLIDAYLWIKRPGDSDGECRGGPAAGRWWPTYALELARNTEARAERGRTRGKYE